MQPNKAVIQRWVDALESGDYPQTRGSLQVLGPPNDADDPPQGFCCLGVLCELAVKDGVIPAPQLLLSGEAEYGADRNSGELPLEVQEWAGLDEPDPYVDYPAPMGIQHRSLAFINDNEGKSFKEIAAVIRHNFLEDE